MAKLKKLINKSDSEVNVIYPLSNEDISKRQTEYPLLGEVDFAKKYRGLLYKEVTLNIEDKEYRIQANFCTNPFCRWFGLPQHKYEDIKDKPSRYKLVGNIDSKSIKCNDIPTTDYEGIVKEVKSGDVNIFTCRVDKTLSKKEAYIRYSTATDNLHEWQDSIGFKGSLKDTAINKIAHNLSKHKFYKYVEYKGKNYPIYRHNPIEHPFPHKDEGIRYVDCLTNLSRLPSLELAEMLYNVDLRSINTYFNKIRRRASILERPIVSGRGEGTSYIYSNFNPKYAHYMLTILRTYLNFCDTFKYKKEDVTPAMLLGIANKPFSLEDIIYFK